MVAEAQDTAAPVVDNVTEPVTAPEPVAAETVVTEVAEAAQPETTETVRSWADSLAEVPDDDLQSNERIRSLIARREESARQKETDRLRREAGKKEVVTQQVSRFLRENDIEIEDSSRLNWLYELAHGHAAYESASEFADALKEQYNIPVNFREEAVTALSGGDFSGYVLKLVDGAAEAKVPEIEARLRKEYDARLTAELKAREIKPPSEPPPTAEVGTPAGGPVTWDAIDKMYSDRQWMELPAARRAELSNQANANHK